MAGQKVEWTFPDKVFSFMRIEVWTIALFGLLLLLFLLLQLRQVFYAILFTVLFVVLYAILGYIIQRLRLVEEVYHLNPNYLQITRSTRHKTKKVVIPTKSISHHKLDRFFLGGYLIAKDKKHLLFFNTKEELQRFEEALKRLFKKR